ncbi:hypothetical protein GBA52_018391 [Prunus armeniaca]|nr:hypothetical protein GBA52_018391 [Prunus armeniaca]
MATPRVSWSAAAIRSALMTTANPVDNSKRPIRDQGFNFTVASPLAMGDGQVDPNRALDPGMIYDATRQDYIKRIFAITRSNKYTCDNASSDLIMDKQ